MKKIKISDKGEKITNKDIENFEREHNILFPTDYRNFLLKYNGGIPNPSDYFCRENEGFNIVVKEDRIEAFGILNFFTLDYINFHYKMHKVPNEFLPIAMDLGNSSYICIGISDKYLDKIYFWQFGPSMNPENEYASLYLVSNSFNEFLENIKEDENFIY